MVLKDVFLKELLILIDILTSKHKKNLAIEKHSIEGSSQKVSKSTPDLKRIIMRVKNCLKFDAMFTRVQNIY